MVLERGFDDGFADFRLVFQEIETEHGVGFQLGVLQIRQFF